MFLGSTLVIDYHYHINTSHKGEDSEKKTPPCVRIIINLWDNCCVGCVTPVTLSVIQTCNVCFAYIWLNDLIRMMSQRSNRRRSTLFTGGAGSENVTLWAESGHLKQVTSKYNPDRLGPCKTKSTRAARLEGTHSDQQVRQIHATYIKCYHLRYDWFILMCSRMTQFQAWNGAMPCQQSFTDKQVACCGQSTKYRQNWL